MQSALPPLPSLSAVQSITIPSDLDAVRSKLVQLIDVLSTLLAQLHYLSLTSPEPSTAHPGILPYTDLLNRYNLVLSHVASLSSFLSSQSDPREKERKGKDKGRDPKKEKWDASLVAPAVPVETDRDWIVGTLLRTKQASRAYEGPRAVLADVLDFACWLTPVTCLDRHLKSRRIKPNCSNHYRRHSVMQRHTSQRWRLITS